MSNPKYKIGTKFNQLIIIGYDRTRSRLRYKCRCDCKNEIIVATYGLIAGKTKSCGCYRKTHGGKKWKTWKGIGDISGQYIAGIKKKCDYQDIKYQLTNEFLWDLFLKQERKCALTGLSLSFIQSYRNDSRDLQTASLDRIDSSGDYTEGNVQWVHKDVNKMKNAFTQDRFVEICKLVATRHS